MDQPISQLNENEKELLDVDSDAADNKTYFEKFHFVNDTDYMVDCSTSLDFPLHMHKAFEYFGQVKGSTEVTVDGTVYLVKPGEAVLIFPFQSHSYVSVDSEEYEYCFFSSEMVLDFYKSYKGLIPSTNLFHYKLPANVNDNNIYQRLALVYNICGSFKTQTKDSENRFHPDDELLKEILIYVEKNLAGKCSLGDIAAELGYDYAYISKQFKRKVGMAFNKYVNMLRVRVAQCLIQNSTMSFSEIMQKCGYNSHRTFDRNFLAFVGENPTEYRNSLRNKKKTPGNSQPEEDVISNPKYMNDPLI